MNSIKNERNSDNDINILLDRLDTTYETISDRIAKETSEMIDQKIFESFEIIYGDKKKI